MTFEEMFDAAKAALLKAKVPADVVIAVQINVTGDGEGIFYAKVDGGALAVEPYDYYDNDAQITVDGTALLEALEKGKAGDVEVVGDPEKAALFSAMLATVPAKRAPRRPAAKKPVAKKTAAKPAVEKKASPAPKAEKAAEKKAAHPAERRTAHPAEKKPAADAAKPAATGAKPAGKADKK